MNWMDVWLMIVGVLAYTLIPSLPALIDLIFSKPDKKEVIFIWTRWVLLSILPNYTKIIALESLWTKETIALMITFLLCILVTDKYKKYKKEK